MFFCFSPIFGVPRKLTFNGTHILTLLDEIRKNGTFLASGVLKKGLVFISKLPGTNQPGYYMPRHKHQFNNWGSTGAFFGSFIGRSGLEVAFHCRNKTIRCYTRIL